MEQILHFFAATAANINEIAADEAREAGATDVRAVPGGVEFSGSLETAYRFALWSRCASRLLLQLGRAEGVETGDQLYHRAMQVSWFENIRLEQSFAVQATVRNTRWLKNSQFGALKIKDAIADQMREIHNVRPSVDTDHPDVRFHVHIQGVHVRFYLDLTGESLHRRGYRRHTQAAALKEHVAAALLIRSGWQHTAPLYDPFCGSGTIPIEATLMASDTAPGLLHPETYACTRWQGHDELLWKQLLDEAEERRAQGMLSMPPIYASDIDPASVQSSADHAANAGFGDAIRFFTHDFTGGAPKLPAETPGFIVTDPPYGIRVESSGKQYGALQLQRLYRAIGENTISRFPGWRLSVICGEPDLLYELPLKPDHTNTLYNGSIRCTAAHYTVFTAEEREALEKKAEERRIARESAPLSPGAEMAANRLQKNMKRLKKYLANNGITSYRLYDADMPEYSAAVDIYENRWIHLQEYAPPEEIEPEKAAARLTELIDAVQRTTGIPYDEIHVKQRRRQRGKEQYGRRDDREQLFIMKEHGLKFFVNFTDYLDTGIFLDHRPVRKLIMEMSACKRFLNLYGYTGTATVHAAAGGALSTMTIDASKKYLAWAEKNMELNGYSGMEHQYVRSDCSTWLQETKHRFDLIFMDPPTFSNSKDRKESFDVQRDHSALIHSAMYHLTFGGTLIFSNNFRKFEMGREILSKYRVEDITEESIPEDYFRNRKIHHCYLIRHREEHMPVKEERETPVKRRVTARKRPSPTPPKAGSQATGSGNRKGTGKGKKKKVVTTTKSEQTLDLDF